MYEVCSVKVVATVHDAVHDIEDDLMKNNDDVRLEFSSHFLFYKLGRTF